MMKSHKWGTTETPDLLGFLAQTIHNMYFSTTQQIIIITLAEHTKAKV